jgi:predicted permease
MHVPLGFVPERALVATIDVPSDVTPERRAELFGSLVTAAAAVPGVSSAALSETTPLSGNTWNNRVKVIGVPASGREEPLAYYNAVTPGWFKTLGTRFVAGRDFSATDSVHGEPVAIVNEVFTRTFTNGRNPIGMSLQQGDTPPRLIVGLVEDAVYEAVREPAPPTAYIPNGQRDGYPPYASITVRATADTVTPLVQPLASALTEANEAVGISIRPLSDHVSAALTQERIVALLSGFFGGLALLLAALGLYGVTAYGVSQRRMEIGVRIALGAQPVSVVRVVMSRLAVLVGCGLAAGTVASVWAGSFVSGLLFGVEAADPRTLSVAAFVVFVTALVAGGIPAVRAARLDPARVLRES